MPGSNPPNPIVQEVRASPPSPSAAQAKILRPQPVRASPLLPPGTVQDGLWANRRFPVARIFQGGGMNGAPLMVQIDNSRALIDQSNPAGLATRPMNGLSAASNADTSVSAQSRAKKQLMDMGVPVSGDYTDAIRQAAGFAFGPKRMPKQGFAASSYSYPARQMVVGATLAGAPIVNPQPTRGSSPNPPRFVTREGGQGPRGQISSSPSEERRRLLSTLQGLGGLGASEFAEDSKHIYADSDWFKNTPAGQSRPTYMGVSCYRSVSDDANANQTFASSCTLSAAAAAAWAKWADDNFGGPTGNAEYRRIAKLVPEIAPAPPWSAAGRLQRGLPQDWDAIAKAVKAKAEELRAQQQQEQAPPAAPPAGGSTGGKGRFRGRGRPINPALARIAEEAARKRQEAAAQPQADSGMDATTIGLSVAALAAVGFVIYKATR